MIILVINEFDFNSNLIQALCNADVEFQYEFEVKSCGIKPPYLVVDGVPLDEERAYKWIKERSKNG